MHYNKNLSSILLVQALPADQMAFIGALEKIEDGFLFGIATDDVEAIDLLQRSMVLPDLIFIDLNLIENTECLKTIQTDPLTNEIPVIVFVDSAEEKRMALQQGVRDVVFKSDQQTELSDQIGELLKTWSRKSTQFFKGTNPQ